MHLEHLSCDGLRNLVEVELSPGRRVTLIVGDNGEGKTNLLEAIHLASSLRPLKPLERQRELLGEGRERGVIRARFEADGPLPVDIVVEGHGKRATVAGKAVRDASELWRKVGVVAFLPDENALVRGGPELRRRMLDRVAFSLDPGFAVVARRFDEALERRNALLKSPRVDVEQLASYDAPYAAAAATLTLARAAAAHRLAPRFAAEARAIGGAALDAALRYQAALDDASGDAGMARGHDELAALALAALGRAREHDVRRRTTSVGPHHDDVALLTDDRRARFLASQGEARALVLALKLAQVRLVTEVRGQAPLLLLDDVAGELDRARAARLFGAVDETGAQTFVTATHTSALPPLHDAVVVHVRDGRVTPREAA